MRGNSHQDMNLQMPKQDIDKQMFPLLEITRIKKKTKTKQRPSNTVICLCFFFAKTDLVWSICWNRTGCNFRFDDLYSSTPCLESARCGLDCYGVLTFDWINIYLLGLTRCVRVDGVALSVRRLRSCVTAKPAIKDQRSYRSISDLLSVACFD